MPIKTCFIMFQAHTCLMSYIDDFVHFFCNFVESLIPKDLDDLKEKVSNLPGKVMTTVNDASDKCLLQ